MRFFILFSQFLFFSIFFAHAQLSSDLEIEFFFDQKIPTRDGIKLSATIVKPKQLTKPLPALFVLTPYIADRNFNSACFFAKNEYIVVTVDIRGRGNSEGVSIPFSRVDGRDGFDVCNWISKQTWCNGKIGMYGGSYLGMVQWLIINEHPSCLKTIVPTASVCPGVDFPKRNNIFYTYLAPYLSFISGNTLNTNSFTNIDFWKQYYLHYFSGEIPYSQLINNSCSEFPLFNDWIKHPSFDNYWSSIIPFESDFAKINIPILTITGYYDDDQHGALYYYKNHLKFGNENSIKNHYLVIGPWDHAGTRNPSTTIGELNFSKNSIIDINNLHLEWFNWTLKNGDKPKFLENNFCYYIMGKDEWETGSSIDFSKKDIIYYLASDGMANDIFHSGILTNVQVNCKNPDTFTYNPLNIGWSNYDLEDGSLVNYSLYKNRESFKNTGVIYHSEPFQEDITIAGQIKLNAYISMDVYDADFEFLLFEIKKDGKTIFLTTDYLRARYSESLKQEKLISKNIPYNYEFNTPYIFIRNISKDSRLRLIIRNLNSPHYQKNFQSGKDVSHETSNDAQTGHFSVYHNFSYPSKLTIPVL